MIKLNDIQQKNWDEWVLKCYPGEAAALVVDGVVIPMTNKSPNPTKAFSIDPTEFWVHKDDIQAVLHSHTYKLGGDSRTDKRIPSAADLKAQINMGCWWGISATEGECVSDILWFGKDRGEPYEGRQFIFNVNDCFELCRDYFRREYNHEVKPWVREWDWFLTEHYFDDNIEAMGWYEVNIDDIKKDDVICFNIRTEHTNHIGLYLGDDKMLHHLYGRLSEIDTLSKWYKQIKRVIRRKETL